MIVVYTERVRYSNCTYHKKKCLIYLHILVGKSAIRLWRPTVVPQPDSSMYDLSNIILRLTFILPDVCCDIFCYLANIWKDSYGNFIVHNDITTLPSAVAGYSTITSFSKLPTTFFRLDQTAPHETRVARLFIFNLGSWSISWQRVEFK